MTAEEESQNQEEPQKQEKHNQSILKDLLVADSDQDIDLPDLDGVDDGAPSDPPKEGKGLCIECGDQPSELYCYQCEEPFCSVCFGYLHRTGNRKSHKTRRIKTKRARVESTGSVTSSQNTKAIKEDPGEESKVENKEENEDLELTEEEELELDGDDEDRDEREGTDEGQPKPKESMASKIKSHCHYIPMRLTSEERKLHRLLEAALNVSEYTDKVDIYMFTSSKSKRMVSQLKEMCSILAGLVVATNMQLGQTLFEDKEFSHNAEWFQDIFEIGRRYKIMNPEKMRDSFGKLMYMVMDSRLPEIKEALDFDLYKPIKTVYSVLEENDCLGILDDDLLVNATLEIIPKGKPRAKVQMEIKRKELALEKLVKGYYKSNKSGFSKDDLRQCLYSIGDYHAYLRANRYPVEAMLKELETHFSPDESVKSQFDLGIQYGQRGARLSHTHEKQYHYVRQSLTLWSQIMRDMFMLWKLADDDLLSNQSRYRLADTGQGLNRIKAAPQVYRAMHSIIHQAQQRTGIWIGSSVVHIGDHTVPNALFFLDKYLQVPRILTPVYLVLEGLDSLCQSDEYVEDWINAQYGSLLDLRLTILCDFFRHAFDGSGADNFYDAGSCIDGRLTSAWNWSNSISKKPYYNKFLVTGFTGFNGTEGF